MLAQVYACAFNPVDDAMVAFVPNDGTALVYQLNDSHLGYDEPRVIQHSDRSTKCIEFSPNGRWLAVGGAGTRPRGTQTIAGYVGKISLYDVDHNFCPAVALQETENTVFSCAFSACSCYLACAGYGQPLRVWQVATGLGGTLLGEPDECFEFYAAKVDEEDHWESIKSSPFSPCGSYLAGLSQRGKLRVLKASKPNDWHEKEDLFSHDSRLETNSNACRFSERPLDGRPCRFIATACACRARLSPTRAPRLALISMYPLRAPADRTGLVVVRKVMDGHLVCVIDDEKSVPKLALAFSSDEQGLLFVASSSGINFYHNSSQTVATRLRDPDRPLCLALSASHRAICYGTQRAGGRRLVICALRFDGGDQVNRGDMLDDEEADPAQFDGGIRRSLRPSGIERVLDGLGAPPVSTIDTGPPLNPVSSWNAMDDSGTPGDHRRTRRVHERTAQTRRSSSSYASDDSGTPGDHRQRHVRAETSMLRRFVTPPSRKDFSSKFGRGRKRTLSGVWFFDDDEEPANAQLHSGTFVCGSLSSDSEHVCAVLGDGQVFVSGVDNKCTLIGVRQIQGSADRRASATGKNAMGSAVQSLTAGMQWKRTAGKGAVMKPTESDHVAISPTGKLIAITYDHGQVLCLKHTDRFACTEQHQQTIEGRVEYLEFSRNGEYLACYTNSKRLFVFCTSQDAGKLQVERALFNRKVRDSTESASCFTFIAHADGERIAVPRLGKLEMYTFNDSDSGSDDDVGEIVRFPQSFEETAVIDSAHDDRFGTVIACGLKDGVIVLIDADGGRILCASLPGYPKRHIDFSCIKLLLGEMEASDANCRIVFGDASTHTVSVLEPVSTTKHFKTIAVTRAFGYPRAASIHNGTLLVLGSLGMRTRDWSLMLSLPPPADFEATTCVDERLVEENMKLFPYLLWMTPRDNRGSRSHSHEDVTATEPGGAQLIRKRKFPLLRTLLPIAQGAAAAAPGLLANAVLRRQRESVELLVWSLLRDCEPSARATTLLNGVKGMNDISRPLLARLIQYYPASMAMVLNDMSNDMVTCGEEKNCECLADNVALTSHPHALTFCLCFRCDVSPVWQGGAPFFFPLVSEQPESAR